MASDIERARRMLEEGEYTCVLVRGDMVLTSRERGVKPLLGFLDSGEDAEKSSAADRVVGRAAAFLYVLLGVRYVYAHVMSRPAAEVLERYGISAECDVLADAIINRAGDGLCLMECAVMDIEDPQSALSAIRAKLESLAARRSE